MSEGVRSRRGAAFRLLLVLGAAVFAAVGAWGLLWTRALTTTFGFKITGDTAGFDGLARLFAATMLALAFGYALAAAQPQGSRSLLVVLFVAPFVMGCALIASVARSEIAGVRGVVYAVVSFAYCLLFFRTYPRLEDAAPDRRDPPSHPTGDAPAAP